MRGREGERERADYSTPQFSLYFALSLLSTQSTESSPVVFVLVEDWGKRMGHTNREQIKTKRNLGKKTTQLMQMDMYI